MKATPVLSVAYWQLDVSGYIEHYIIIIDITARLIYIYIQEMRKQEMSTRN